MKSKIFAAFFFCCIWAVHLSAREPSASALPWEYWEDPGVLSSIPEGLHAVGHSSHAEGWAAFDRSSEGDTRFLEFVDGEAVIFKAEGRGILSRIWMTQGNGRARGIDPGIRLRIRIDGAAKPVLDVPAADFFSGKTPDAKRPLVLEYRHHGGGNVSRLPISFRSGCRVSLVGVEKAKLWYQVNGMVWDSAPQTVATSLKEDARRLSKFLKKAGRDPWPMEDTRTEHASLRLESGQPRQVFQRHGSGQINALLLNLPRKRWPDVELRMVFDGKKNVKLRLPWFFGVGGASCPPPRSMFIGGLDGTLYSYFPMPFRKGVTVSLRLLSGAPVDLEYSVRFSGTTPRKDAGLFEARAIDSMGFRGGQSSELLRVEGACRLAGLLITAGGVGGSWDFLEGDEEFFIDGEKDASWHGTGVEDFFGGGFYFRGDGAGPLPFYGPVSGLSCVHAGRPESVAMYRLMSAEGPVARRELILRWEGGAQGDVAVRWRGVAWLYRREQGEGDETDHAG